MFVLQDTQKVKLSVSFVDAAGNPADVDGAPGWDSSDPSVVAVEPSEDGLSCYAVAVGPLGSAQVSVTADALIGEGKEELVGVLDFQVVASKAVAVAIAAGQAEPK